MESRCKQIAGKEMDLAEVCLGQLWLFQNLDRSDLEAFCCNAQRKKMTKGQALFVQGDPADELFLIKGGRVKLNKVLENGTELILDMRKAGDFLGENMLSGEDRYPVSAFCLEDTLTCGFSRGQFETLILRHPNIGLAVIKNMSERISWLTGRVGSLAVSNIEDRLHQVLCNIANEHGTIGPRGVEIRFPLTHEDLSFLTGAHRVSITRAIKTLTLTGKLIQEGKKLIIPSLDMEAGNG